MAKLSLKLNQSMSLDGYVTQYNWLRGQASLEIERRIGYGSGRLADGWYLLFLKTLPGIDDFDLKGYSHLPDGIPTGGHEDAEASLKTAGFDIRKLKLFVIKKEFSVSGPKRLVKVLPVAGGSAYPPGSGIPQWRLTKKLSFSVGAVVPPGGKCP